MECIIQTSQKKYMYKHVLNDGNDLLFILLCLLRPVYLSPTCHAVSRAPMRGPWSVRASWIMTIGEISPQGERGGWQGVKENPSSQYVAAKGAAKKGRS